MRKQKEQSTEKIINETVLNDKQKRIDNMIDDAKDIVEKAIDITEDAARVATEFAGNQLKNAKNIFDKVSNNITESISRRTVEKYGPIFPEGLEEIATRYPKMIDVVEYDKQMEIDECKGAVGFKRNINNVDLLGIYQKDVNKFNEIEFYPDRKPSASVYYVHPLNDKQFIEITEYFKFLKEQRVAELEYIAQELGAKYFKVQILEETLSSEVSKTKTAGKLGFKKNTVGVNIENDDSQNTYEFIGIAAENRYPGKEPREPHLKLWANNESIKNLVKQRLSSDNPLQSKTFRLDYNTSSGIKEKEAAKIDGVLKILKFNAAGSIQKEATKESKRKLEYTIEF